MVDSYPIKIVRHTQSLLWMTPSIPWREFATLKVCYGWLILSHEDSSPHSNFAMVDSFYPMKRVRYGWLHRSARLNGEWFIAAVYFFGLNALKLNMYRAGKWGPHNWIRWTSFQRNSEFWILNSEFFKSKSSNGFASPFWNKTSTYNTRHTLLVKETVTDRRTDGPANGRTHSQNH